MELRCFGKSIPLRGFSLHFFLIQCAGWILTVLFFGRIRFGMWTTFVFPPFSTLIVIFILVPEMSFILVYAIFHFLVKKLDISFTISDSKI